MPGDALCIYANIPLSEAGPRHHSLMFVTQLGRQLWYLCYIDRLHAFAISQKKRSSHGFFKFPLAFFLVFTLHLRSSVTKNESNKMSYLELMPNLSKYGILLTILHVQLWKKIKSLSFNTFYFKSLL